MSGREAEQAEVVAFLSDPRTYGLAGEGVEVIETHAARVFLAGSRAYKMKRAVAYTFLDFTTLEERRRACEAELTLNRRTAPALYLGLIALVRREGRLALGGPGEVLEWLVEMRRFPLEATLDRLAGAGRLTEALLRELADAVLALHAVAERRGPPYGGGAVMGALVKENAANLAELEDLIARDAVAPLEEATASAAERLAPLLDRRRREGWVRRCHGDLHLANVVLWEGHPLPFDCLEFSEDLATVDVAYDLAFLLMDLEVRGLGAFANLVMSRYFALAGGLEVLAALPFFLAVRATVRAKVAGFLARDLTGTRQAAEVGRARKLLQAARSFLEPTPARLLAIGGLSGTGKSTLARRLAPGLGRVPGALHLPTDLLRKRHFGVAPETALPPSAYGEKAGREIYGLLLREARCALAAGQAVVLDGVFARQEERAAAEALAQELGVRFDGLWLEAPAETLLARVATRRGDVSDATEAVVRRQLSYGLGDITWRRLAAGARPQDLAAAASRLLQDSGATRSR